MKKVIIKLWMLIVAIVLGFASCEDLTNDELPTVLTNEVTDITANGALCGGYVSARGGGEVVARGVCYSTTPNPEVNNSRTDDGQGMGGYTSTLEGLTAATTYYVRAYATNACGTAYGEERTFTTATSTGDTNDTTQNNGNIPSVTTNDVTDVTTNSAVCGGNVISDGGSAVTAYGICWSTTPNPTIDNSYTQDGQGIGNFVSSITELLENTTYYVRAYAINVNGTAYGEERSFTTLAGNTINGHEYVDLGLPSGLKWATHNVGASTPEGYGEYFAWGETSVKTEYTEDNSTTFGVDMSDISGNATYDAARANWGSTWRIPTKTEMEELVNNCTWTWTTKNGVNGMSVVGINGNSIFLPAGTGFFFESSLEEVGGGFYWTSTPDGESNEHASCLIVDDSGADSDGGMRCLGMFIRPISE